MGCKCKAWWWCCCCCDLRNGSLFIGIINLVSGTIGVVTLSFILLGLTVQMNQLENSQLPPDTVEEKLDSLTELYWTIILAYAFPAVVTFIVGFTVILGASNKNEYFILTSVVFNVILMIILVSVSLLMLAFGVDWKLVIGMPCWAIIQLYFTIILLSYRSLELVKNPDELYKSEPSI